jgi:hypothetical protein
MANSVSVIFTSRSSMSVLVGAVAGTVSMLVPAGDIVTTVEVGTSEVMTEEVEASGSEQPTYADTTVLWRIFVPLRLL